MEIEKDKYTRISFTLDLSSHLQTVRDEQSGDINEWVMGGEINQADVESGAVEEPTIDVSNIFAKRWRLVVEKVNGGNQLSGNSCRLK